MHAWRRGLARRRAARDRRAKILCVEPAGRCHHHDARRCNQGQMDLRTGAPADEGGTGPRPLRRQILDGVTPTCLDDDDRLRLPPIPPPQSSGTEKKESQDRHHSRACPPSGKPSSTSSCSPHPCDALIVKCSSRKPLNPKCQSSARFVELFAFSAPNRCPLRRKMLRSGGNRLYGVLGDLGDGRVVELAAAEQRH